MTTPLPPHQPTPPQPQVGQFQPGAQPVPQGAPGFIDFTVQGNWFTKSFIPPQVSINGFAVNVTAFETTRLRITPGIAVIEASTPNIWGPFGRAGLQCHVQPGQIVPVFYGAPYFIWFDGAMGHEPQQRKGFAGYVAYLGCAGLLLLGALGFFGFIIVASSTGMLR